MDEKLQQLYQDAGLKEVISGARDELKSCQVDICGVKEREDSGKLKYLSSCLSSIYLCFLTSQTLLESQISSCCYSLVLRYSTFIFFISKDDCSFAGFQVRL